MCWASNHQNIYRNGPRAHFPFNLPLFGDLCQHVKKQQKKCKINAIEDQIVLTIIWPIWITLCHHLVCFCKSNYFFLSLSQTHLFGQIERYSMSRIDQVPKTPPFPIIKILPHKRPSFAIIGFRMKYKF